MLDLDEMIKAKTHKHELIISGLNEAKQLRAQNFDFSDQERVKESIRANILAQISKGLRKPSDLRTFLDAVWIDAPDNAVLDMIHTLVDTAVLYQDSKAFLCIVEKNSYGR